MEESNKRKGMSKGIIATVIAVVLIAGGSIAAVILTNLSPKQAYFLAEKNTIEYLEERFMDRYEAEMEWSEQSYENPTEQTVELSAEYNGPTEPDGYQAVDPAQIINNSSLSITAQADMENKQLASELALDIAGFQIEDLSAYLTDEKIMVGLPFMDEYLQIMDEDLGPLLYELDPMAFTGNESLELDTVFEGNGVFTDEDIEYLQTEYVEFIYDELPDDAFDTAEEAIEVNGETLDTEKIEFHLSEQQVRDLFSTIFEKIETDERLKELLNEQLAANQVGDPALDADIDQMLTEFENAMAEAKEGVHDFQFTDGVKSTIWVHNDVIVQRDIFFELGPDQEDLISLGMNGTQVLNDTTQNFEYDLDFSDSVSSGTMNIVGDLSWEDNEATDSINLTFGEYNLAYDGTETLEDGTREFERVFSYNDSLTDGSLIWDGSSTYDNDQMNSNHQFSIETAELGNLISLQVLVDGQWIDGVEMPAEDNVKDLGNMNPDELTEYFEFEVTPNFQQWLFGIMAGGAAGF